ncbi:MAG TPA: indole-3-glycerol phosphate synthase TrpC [Longimicrobiales bacterium]
MNRNARLSYTVLDRIIETKHAEVERLRREARSLRRRAEERPAPAGFETTLRAGGTVRVIAEVKRRSPSAGEIRAEVFAPDVARAYEAAGAAAISVLTDAAHFGGSLSDLEGVAGVVGVPLLRKDFTVDELQVFEARAAGASAVLLIARILDAAQLADFGSLAGELGLGALVEVHDERELERALRADARIVGVNNRDLGTFTTDLAVTERLGRAVPREVLVVAESGIRGVGDVERLAAAGADAVLVGEALMRSEKPGELIGAFAAVPRVGR